MRTLRATLIALLLSAILTTLTAIPTSAGAEPAPPPPAPTPAFVCCKGPGYALIYDLPATIKIVFTKAVRDWLSVSVLEGCKACLQWVLVDMANKAMPDKVRACVRLPVIGDICSPTIHIRAPFIHDAMTRIDEAYKAIGLARWYYNDCFFWRATGSRYFSHTTTGCRA